MKKLLRIALLCSLALLMLASSAFAQAAIVGEWAGTGTGSYMGMSADGTAEAEFKGDKSFTMAVNIPQFTLNLEFKGAYELVGNHLILKEEQYGNFDFECNLSGNKVVLKGKVNYGFIQGIDFTLNMERKGVTPTPTPTPPSDLKPKIKLVVPEKENVIAKVGKVYETVVNLDEETKTWLEWEDVNGNLGELERGDFTWTSNKPKIAYVCKYGCLRGKKPGMATVKITLQITKKQKISDSVSIRVVSADIKQKTAKLYVGGSTKKKPSSIKLTPVIKPSSASKTAKTVTWATSDPNVATVDEKGRVSAVAPGTATITMTNGYAQQGVCTVTVE